MRNEKVGKKKRGYGRTEIFLRAFPFNLFAIKISSRNEKISKKKRALGYPRFPSALTLLSANRAKKKQAKRNVLWAIRDISPRFPFCNLLAQRKSRQKETCFGLPETFLRAFPFAISSRNEKVGD
ncbi:MAG: hypothetical protein IJV98_08190 [Clostridia bacterium]|nr:hypothetical protein [Clostridia bacterium]